jgi:putative ABC transport system permease protein
MQSYWPWFIHSLRNLFASKLRAFLALLGIVIGTAAVVTLVSIADLASHEVIDRLMRLGSHMISVSVHDMGEDSHSINESTIKNIRSARPEIQQMVAFAYIPGQAYWHGKPLVTQMVAIDPGYPQVMQIKIASGRHFRDLDRDQPSVVLGAKIAEQLHLPPEVLVGQELRIENQYYQILGVLQPWEVNLLVPMDLDRSLLLPISMAKRIDKTFHINDLLVKFSEKMPLDTFTKNFRKTLRATLAVDNIYFRTPSQWIEQLKASQRTYTWLLGAIGSISLLVGGIGIMNVMLMSVIERRSEIGIRMAVGASSKDIQHMFLFESTVLAVVGGLIGIVFAQMCIFLIAQFAGWHYHVLFWTMGLGFIISLLVGIFFGFYPARRASKLSPIQALKAVD